MKKNRADNTKVPDLMDISGPESEKRIESVAVAIKKCFPEKLVISHRDFFGKSGF